MTTLTYMLKGSFQHEDFTGRKGIIEPGDLQFMLARTRTTWCRLLRRCTRIAGRGISHAEMPIHGGGRDNPIGLQLSVNSSTPRIVADIDEHSWIDLPKQHKMVEPSYQELKADQVPTAVVNPFVSMKVISGKADAENGKVVESPVRPLGGCWFFDVTITKKGESVFQAIPQGWNSFVRFHFYEPRLEIDLRARSTPSKATQSSATTLSQLARSTQRSSPPPRTKPESSSPQHRTNLDS